MPINGAAQTERRSNLRAVRMILSQWKKVRRSHVRVVPNIPSQLLLSRGQPSYGLPA